MIRALSAIGGLAIVAVLLSPSGNANAGGPSAFPGSFVVAQQRFQPPFPYRPHLPPGPRIPKFHVCIGPDLAISAIAFQFSHIYNPNEQQPHADYEVIPIVKNVGSREWVSGHNEQGVNLDVVGPGGTRHVNYSNFNQLEAPGHSSVAFLWPEYGVEVTHVHGYRAYLTYGPDIRNDGNPKNDDCNLDNQSMTVSARQVRQAIMRRQESVIIRR